jgi:protocatechuate 3,4-dioxygenase beta subunit
MNAAEARIGAAPMLRGMRSLRRWFSCASFAAAVLVGSVTDQTTGQPLTGVEVRVGSAHAKTNADGAYKLVGVKPGRSAVTVSSDDVPPQQFTVRVGSGTTHRDFTACSITLDYRCSNTP